jgi:DNA-binding MurR/RpiR family transcriptional regulator
MLLAVQNGFDQDTLDALRPAERVVAQYLLESGPEALVMSAAALAQQLGTSDATVVRTARSLGFSGLGELRRALASRGSAEPRLAERLHRTLTGTPPDALLANGVANLRVGLQSLEERIAPQDFERAVTVLASRERVVWRGVGPSACLADYGRLLCERVGKKSSSLVHTGTSFADELLALHAEDAVVLLAYGRPQVHIDVLLDRAEAVGAPVVLLTDTTNRRLVGRVEIALQSGRGIPGLFASHATTLVVLEALVLGIAASNRPAAEASLELLNSFRAALAGRKLDVDSA